MNTRFVIPVSAALALHVALFVSFRRPAYTKPIKDPYSKPEKPFVLPTEIIEIVEPGKSAAAEGSPDVAKPELPETPSPIERPVFSIDSRPPSPEPINKKALTIGNLGIPEGVPGGIGVDLGSIIPSGALDNPPHTRTQISPNYPYHAQTTGLTGTVWVEFIVDRDGYVHDPVVVRSTDRVFEEPTVRAVSRWRFEPGKRGGRPVSFRMVVPVVFNLTDV